MTKRFLLFASAVTVLTSVMALATVHRPAAQPEGTSEAVAIGIVRSDGILFPLARVQNGEWTALAIENPVTGGSELTSVARGLPRTGWTAFPVTGGKPFSLIVREIASVDSHCVEIEGFRTDAPTRPLPPNTWPRPKTAIAVWGAGRVGLSERVRAPYDPAARRAVGIIVALTHSIELERVQAAANSPLARYTAAERGRVPVHVTTLVRRSFSDRVPHYFEARKRYGSGFDLFVSGWLVLSDDDVELMHTKAEVTDRDYISVETALVLGVVELADRAVWVVEAHGYESEAYVLMEFLPFEMARRAVRIMAGGC